MSRDQDVREASTATGTIRSAVYLEPALHQAVRPKAAATRRTMSEMINDAPSAALGEDEADLAAFAAWEFGTGGAAGSIALRLLARRVVASKHASTLAARPLVASKLAPTWALQPLVASELAPTETRP